MTEPDEAAAALLEASLAESVPLGAPAAERELVGIGAELTPAAELLGRRVEVTVSSGSQVSSVALALALMAAPKAPRVKRRRAAKAPALWKIMMDDDIESTC